MKLKSLVRSALVMLLLALTSAPSHAKIAIGESLDWVVVSRPHIALVRVVDVEEGGVPEGAQYFERTIRIRIQKVLKGNPPERASFIRFVHIDTKKLKHGEDKNSPPAAEAEFLLFFDDKKEVSYGLDLTHPTNDATWLAYGQDFTILASKASILDAVQRRLVLLQKSLPPAGAAELAQRHQSLRLEVPERTAAFKSLYGGSDCYLVVPADPEYKAKLLKQARSQNVSERARAAYWLRNYPGKETVEVLKALLGDSGTQGLQRFGDGDSPTEVILSSGGTTIVYPARQAAYSSLKALGIDVPKPKGYYEDYPEFFFR